MRLMLDNTACLVVRGGETGQVGLGGGQVGLAGGPAGAGGGPVGVVAGKVAVGYAQAGLRAFLVAPARRQLGIGVEWESIGVCAVRID